MNISQCFRNGNSDTHDNNTTAKTQSQSKSIFTLVCAVVADWISGGLPTGLTAGLLVCQNEIRKSSEAEETQY
tara:strand:- start:1403 stop:1621 length:219 start_codon:yes stop_codon:yes gene_type:complete